ncbi:unnamed protein product [Acanthoscelides obtectus]|uniref:Uncharacterized protein n=1 Tax=Acanthoscelides obtectus TaxID=200917 RepID=A0A9P0PBL2_ACAOB|nr:unnamed protein product [Acanthoscelides obtectus]CAK1665323.1 hypothetical protein AOBTE_LOCUS24760 [Acanthoscelides obtectus]
MEQPVVSDKDIPQWKKDLIARLRSQNRTAAAAAISNSNSSPNRQSTSTGASANALVRPAVPSEPLASHNGTNGVKMVQERVWATESVGYRKADSDSDSEDLHYGPGIVKKLKNKYLSLALRESNARPTILHMRKATSLEHLLDEEPSNEKHVQTRQETRRNAPNRYRNASRGEMKRARSVETISRTPNNHIPANSILNRQLLHEEIALKENGEYPIKSQENITSRINRPKRIQPLLSEKEKPPVDKVKQAKMIFERRPEQRTRAPPQTGEVQAKVECFNNRIVKAKVEAKVAKKPPIKHTKPVLTDKVKCNAQKCPKSLAVDTIPAKRELTESLPSPIPDVSRIDFQNGQCGDKKNSTLSETPDLILTSSPMAMLTSPTYKANSTEHFLKEEIRNCSPLLNSDHHQQHSPKHFHSPLLSPVKGNMSPTSPKSSSRILSYEEEDGRRKVQNGGPHVNTANTTSIFNFTNKPSATLNSNICEEKTPPSVPLQIDVNGSSTVVPTKKRPHISPPRFSPPPPPKLAPETPAQVAEKNLRNLQQNGAAEVVNRNVVVVTKRTSTGTASTRCHQESTTAVFNFTNRKDVPDYIANDRSRSPSKPELPKVSVFEFMTYLV